MPQSDGSIPFFDYSRLLAASSDARESACVEFCRIAGESGCMVLTGLDTDTFGPEARDRLATVFEIDDAERRRLSKQTFIASNPNVYRGWFPRADANRSGAEGIDLGPDLVRNHARTDPTDPITEPTPLPAFAGDVQWLDATRSYYDAVEAVGFTLMRSIATGLRLERSFFDQPFSNGVSTLRLLRYAQCPGDAASGTTDQQPAILTGAHVDSGLVTLLAQDGVGGLQFESHEGAWIDVPPAPASLVVNFGLLLERWTQGQIRATRHRVLDRGVQRTSIPFFFEPAETAIIAPLPGAEEDQFEPFLYGDYLWDKATQFKEQSGARSLRAPRGRLAATS